MAFGAELDLYDAGAKLVADLIVDQYPDLVELELDGNETAFWPQCGLCCLLATCRTWCRPTAHSIIVLCTACCR